MVLICSTSSQQVRNKFKDEEAKSPGLKDNDDGHSQSKKGFHA
jgi:hypothetical protein